MTGTMIERIARHLCEREGGDPDEIRHGEGKAAGQTWRGWQAYASEAAGLLAVMREPTEGMVGAGVIRTVGVWPDERRRAELCAEWHAMIEAALSGR